MSFARIVWCTGMETLPGLIGYTFVAAVTPGPNNVVLWATGIQFGFRAAMPYLAGDRRRHDAPWCWRPRSGSAS